MKLLFFANPNKNGSMQALERLLACAGARGVKCAWATDADRLLSLADEGWKDALCLVTLGGDGTILSAVYRASKLSMPVLGVNLGRVGFFSEISGDEFDGALTRLSEGNYYIERKMMLSCYVNDKFAGDCLNDFTIHRQALSSIVQLNYDIDGDEVGNLMADGLIVSTPSGSTGYTISAGGSVVAPRLECLLVTPICPHSLTVRPIVAPSDSEVRIKAISRAQLLADGRRCVRLYNGDIVLVRQSDSRAEFIRFEKRNIFKLIREKLM